MIQENVKRQLANIQNTGSKVKTELRTQLQKAETEGKKLLEKVTGSKIEEGTTLSEIVQKARAQNPTFKRLLLNVDTATYDAREQLKWNANMMAAYAKMQAGKSIETEIKPAVKACISSAEAKFSTLIAKASQLSERLRN
jgi:hypothetical protein